MSYDEKTALKLAEYKLGIIAPAINGTYPDPTMAAYFRRIASEPLELPDGSKVCLKPSTIASWRRRYLKDGFDALMPKKRSDLGTSRRIDADLAQDIQAVRTDHPGISAAMCLEMLVEEGYVTQGELSVATMQRFFKRNSGNKVDVVMSKDRRAFEAARVNGIWQADTLYGPYVGTPAHRAYLQAVIDDKSRKIVCARFVEHDNAATFQETLKRAIASHGIPEKLFVDNGSPYKNGQLSYICGSLGIVLLHAAVRDGAAKGKIERWNRTIRMRFLSTLPETATGGFDQLNTELAKWVAAYNAHVHSSTKLAPTEAFAAEADKLKWVEGGAEALTEAFRNRITRKVANDSTVRVDHVLYDVPMGLIGEKVEIRFTPNRTDDTWIVIPDGNYHHVIPTNKTANAESGRIKPTYQVNYIDGREKR